MYYYELTLDDNKTILIEAADPIEDDSFYEEVSTKKVKKHVDTFNNLYSPVFAYIKKIGETIDMMTEVPDEIGVEFSVKLSGDTGVIIAKAGAEASATIKLTWKKEKK